MFLLISFAQPELKIANASSATKGIDFTPSSIIVSFPVDAETAKATINLVDDVEVENLETLILELVPVHYGSTATFASTTINIRDNDGGHKYRRSFAHNPK